MTRPRKIAWPLFLLAGAGVLGVFVFLGWAPVRETIVTWYHLIADPEQVENLKKAWGPIGGPLAFIGLQILQVVLAPFPGEASGFVGGYLFGAIPGLIYSTIGLTIGSIINFLLARVLGRRYVAKWMPADSLERFDRLAKHQGTILILCILRFSGFPKGLSLHLPWLTGSVLQGLSPHGRDWSNSRNPYAEPARRSGFPAGLHHACRSDCHHPGFCSSGLHLASAHLRVG